MVHSKKKERINTLNNYFCAKTLITVLSTGQATFKGSKVANE